MSKEDVFKVYQAAPGAIIMASHMEVVGHVVATSCAGSSQRAIDAARAGA
jgi:hypothetical protein